MLWSLADNRAVNNSMECFLQYLDDLDDAYGAVGLVWEHLRRTILKLVSLTMILGVAASGVLLALAHPPIALAISTLLIVMLLYRSVTGNPGKWTHAG